MGGWCVCPMGGLAFVLYSRNPMCCVYLLCLSQVNQDSFMLGMVEDVENCVPLMLDATLVVIL
jgi:hypothetical protein